MRKLATLLVAVALPLGSLAASSQQDPPEGIDHVIEVVKGETQQVSAAGGTGGSNLTGNDDCSSSSYNATCEKTLALFKASGTASVDVTPKYPSDYDLVVYLSDETGALIEEVTSSETFYTPVQPGEAAEFDVKAGQYYVLIVHYFAGGGGYFMNASVA